MRAGLPVEARAHRVGELRPGAELRGALVARPAEVAHGARRRGVPVDLLPLVPADVRRPDLARAGPDGEPERVAQALGDDAVRLAAQRVAGRGRARVRVQAQDRAVEADGVAGGAQVLGAQRAALPRRVAARVAGAPGRRPLVGVVEARAVAGGGVQGPVCAEGEAADAVARELLAPAAAEQDGRDPAVHVHPHDPPVDDAALIRRAGRGRAVVRPARQVRPRCRTGRRTAAPDSRGRPRARSVRGPSSRARRR